jgi:hypothetical protein
MTKPPYPSGWTAESEDRGLAGSPADYAWNVNFNNGNTNYNHHDNNGFVRAVRASEYRRAATFQDLHTAWREARRGKRPSESQLEFEVCWIDELLALQHELNALGWRPSAPTCFVAKHPKAREIHAPAFRDRVVHHWLVPELERIYEPLFIFDSFSNRKGKGTHAAVRRLQRFMRQVDDGWYLQLDIRNFFNTIHRPTLYALLKDRMTRHGIPLPLRHAVHALLARSALDPGVQHACTPAERAAVPAHKQLANAAPGCGIAIGNLSSQFFANVYLNELDQFVKHELGARRYIRYVDDFVLVDESREQLVEWHAELARFLEEHLKLELKPDVKLRPIGAGADFLGYIVRKTHLIVRPRVVLHAREKLRKWAGAHVRRRRVRATPAQYREIRSVWSSYAGHFSHAASGRLHGRIRKEFKWLGRALRAANRATRSP